jgi:hypothetical protein
MWISSLDNPSEKKEYRLIFDNYGHPYLQCLKTNKQSKLDFDRHNNIVSYIINESLTDLYDVKIHKMGSTAAKTLQSIAKKKYQQDNENDDDNDENVDIDYYYEDEEYLIEGSQEDDDNDDDGFFGTEKFDLCDDKFIFSNMINNDNNILIYQHPDYQSCCLFETLVYDKNKIIFKAHLVNNDNVCFRMIINLDGIVSFRVIDQTKKDFFPYYDKTGELVFKSL